MWYTLTHLLVFKLLLAILGPDIISRTLPGQPRPAVILAPSSPVAILQPEELLVLPHLNLALLPTSPRVGALGKENIER